MSLIELSLACGERLRVHRFSIREAVSSLFSVQVIARSADPCLDLGVIVGRPAALRVASGYRFERGAERLWSGLCHHARLVQAVDAGAGEVALSTYEIDIAPQLWLLTQRTDHRVVQHKSIPEIVQGLLETWSIPAAWNLQPDEHPRLTYRVQYGEEDFAFMSRLLEEAGIAYAFSDKDGENAVLVLSDALDRTAPRRERPIDHLMNPSATSEREHVTRVSVEERVRSGGVVLRDADFRRPAFPLLSEARRASPDAALLERYHYRPGGFLLERDADSHDPSYGAQLAARALEAERTGRRLVAFVTNAIDLRPGTVFSIDGHPRADLDPSVGLLVTSLSIEGSPDGEWTIRGEAVPADERYRPPMRTRKPRVHGVQSGVIVGPPGQEIHTDEHGRVRVQLAWDREGRLDETSSCWLRVSQGWAGAGYGMFALPRVGQEVLVAFLDGDPDQPIVVGRVPNVLNPLPVRLPEEKTQSAWRSASSPGAEGFNEIRFEDARGAEVVSVHAARDLRERVEQDEVISVGRHRAKAVGGNEHARTEGRVVMYVGQDAHVTVEGELRERVGGTRSLTVEADRHEAIAGAAALAAGGEIHIKAGTALVLEGGDVTLRGPGGFVRIDGGGVTIDGGAVQIKQGGAPGAGHGAHPALPVVPLRGNQAQGPRPLPLPNLPAIPKHNWPNRGRPLNEDELFICGLICQCVDSDKSALCVRRKLQALDKGAGGLSPYKAEVPYDMSKTPPEPIMSNNDPSRLTTGNPSGSRVPDVVVVHDPSKLPTQDNIKEVIEIKFDDSLSKEQAESYEQIAGGPTKLRVLDPDECGCPKNRGPKLKVKDLLKAAGTLALALLLLRLLLLGPASPLAPVFI